MLRTWERFPIWQSRHPGPAGAGRSDVECIGRCRQGQLCAQRTALFKYHLYTVHSGVDINPVDASAQRFLIAGRRKGAVRRLGGARHAHKLLRQQQLFNMHEGEARAFITQYACARAGCQPAKPIGAVGQRHLLPLIRQSRKHRWLSRRLRALCRAVTLLERRKVGMLPGDAPDLEAACQPRRCGRVNGGGCVAPEQHRGEHAGQPSGGDGVPQQIEHGVVLGVELQDRPCGSGARFCAASPQVQRFTGLACYRDVFNSNRCSLTSVPHCVPRCWRVRRNPAFS